MQYLIGVRLASFAGARLGMQCGDGCTQMKFFAIIIASFDFRNMDFIFVWRALLTRDVTLFNINGVSSNWRKEQKL